MTKPKKTPKARARARAKAPAQPAAQAAPTPQPAPAAVVQEVRPRWDPTIPPRDRNPRPLGPLTKTARLVRGTSYTLNWSDSPVYFHKPGPAVLIVEAEFERLIKAVDKIDFADPSSNVRTIRSIRKFVFADAATGKAIELEPLADVEGGPFALSAGDQAARDRKFEGAEFTNR